MEMDDIFEEPQFEEEDDLEDAYMLEQNQDDIETETENKEKITPPIMSLFEKSKILSERINQLDTGYKTTMPDEVKEQKLTSSFDIAMLEFKNKKLPPFAIKREMPNGGFELWSHNDFEYIP